jgi:hypothetical protein
MSGSAGGRAEKDPSRRAPRHAAHPSAWLHQFKRLRIRYERRDFHQSLDGWCSRRAMREFFVSGQSGPVML